MKIGLAIAMRREQIGLTQEELANAVGVSKASVCRWESGDISNMRRDRIQKLAQALKISPLELLNEEVDGFFSNIKENAPNDEIRSAIIEKVNNMSDEQAKKFLDFLNSFPE